MAAETDASTAGNSPSFPATESEAPIRAAPLDPDRWRFQLTVADFLTASLCFGLLYGAVQALMRLTLETSSSENRQLAVMLSLYFSVAGTYLCGRWATSNEIRSPRPRFLRQLFWTFVALPFLVAVFMVWTVGITYFLTTLLLIEF